MWDEWKCYKMDTFACQKKNNKQMNKQKNTSDIHCLFLGKCEQAAFKSDIHCLFWGKPEQAANLKPWTWLLQNSTNYLTLCNSKH